MVSTCSPKAEVYQWLLRANGFKVSSTAYFVFCNGLKTPDAFNGRLEFDMTILPYVGNDKWVEPVLYDIKKCLNKRTLPAWGAESEWGPYVEKAMKKIKELGG